VINQKLATCQTLSELRYAFATSDEFREAVPSFAPLNWPSIDVDIQAN